MRKTNKTLWIVQGLLAVALGTVALIYPWATFRSAIVLFGILLLLQGTFNLVYGLAGISIDMDWPFSVVYGILSLFLSFGVLILPGLDIVKLAYILAAWIFLSGVFEILRGIVVRRLWEKEFLLIMSGVLSIILSVLMIAFPVTTLLSFTWVIAVYLIFWGLLLIAQSIRLSGLSKERNGEETE